MLDEADTLLDLGFQDTINQILNSLPKQRRTGLFSATQTKGVKELARAGMRNPVSITVRVQNDDKMDNFSAGTSRATPSTLHNSFTVAEYDKRPDILANFFLNHKLAKIIVFVSTCACVDYFSSVFGSLVKEGVEMLPKDLLTVGLHGILDVFRMLLKNMQKRSN